MSNNHVVVVVESFERGVHLLMAEVAEVRFGDPGMKNNDEEALVALIADADAVCITSRGAFTRRVIEAAPKLKIIAKCGAPPSNVDIACATALGIPVTWTPGSNAISVAEHALALILSILKHLPQTASALLAGRWHTAEMKAAELSGRSVGIVGLGQAGYQLARLLAPFGVEVLCHDPFVSAERVVEVGARATILDELLAGSDLVSLNCQSSPATRHMINAASLAKMRPGAYLVNTGRGALIDEAALCEALKGGIIAGAALDVFEVEPPSDDNPLLKLPNVIATPHMAGWTAEALVREARGAAEEIVRVLGGEAPIHVMNPDYVRFTT